MLDRRNYKHSCWKRCRQHAQLWSCDLVNKCTKCWWPMPSHSSFFSVDVVNSLAYFNSRNGTHWFVLFICIALIHQHSVIYVIIHYLLKWTVWHDDKRFKAKANIEVNGFFNKYKKKFSEKKKRGKNRFFREKKGILFLKKLDLVTRIRHYIGSTQNSSEQFTCQFEWCCLALKRFVLLFSHLIFLSICPANATRLVIGIKFDSNLLLKVSTKKLIWLIKFPLNAIKWMSLTELPQ